MIIGLCVFAQRPKLLRFCYDWIYRIGAVYVKVSLKKGWYP